MSDGAALLVTLDTTPPRLTWGAPSAAAVAGLLAVGYSVDEPGVAAASLRLADGRRLTMTVAAERLSVVLPADAPAGAATIEALLRDDVGNETTASTDVVLERPVVPLPPAVDGHRRWSARTAPRPPARRVAAPPSRVRVTSASTVTARIRTRSVVTVTGESSVKRGDDERWLVALLELDLL